MSCPRVAALCVSLLPADFSGAEIAGTMQIVLGVCFKAGNNNAICSAHSVTLIDHCSPLCSPSDLINYVKSSSTGGVMIMRLVLIIVSRPYRRKAKDQSLYFRTRSNIQSLPGKVKEHMQAHSEHISTLHLAWWGAASLRVMRGTM